MHGPVHGQELRRKEIVFSAFRAHNSCHIFTLALSNNRRSRAWDSHDTTSRIISRRNVTQERSTAGPASIADTPEKRSAILNLLERARQNNNLHVKGMNPFDLKASFNSALSDAALKLVKNTNYGPARKRELVQRDVFINVQFVTQ
jgi:hypothetical protein